MIGTSSADTSIYALSIPSPKSADMRCSTVDTRAPLHSITVAMVVLLTLVARAGIAGAPGRSERQNTMPVSMAAGRITMTTFSPVCRPTPVARTELFRVRCLIILPIISDRYVGAIDGRRAPLAGRGPEPAQPLLLGHRAREKIALQALAAELGEQAAFLLGLHPLCHDVEAQLRTDRHHHAHQVLVGALVQAAHEGLVDLDRVQRQVLQQRERRVAGAEVVERDAHAERAQLAQLGDGLLDVEEHRALGDLEAKAPRVDRGCLDDGPHARHEIGTGELPGAHVDREVAVER